MLVRFPYRTDLSVETSAAQVQIQPESCSTQVLHAHRTALGQFGADNTGVSPIVMVKPAVSSSITSGSSVTRERMVCNTFC